MRTFISLLLVISLALFSLWFQDLFKAPDITRQQADQHFPDYFMENFSVTNMNKQGQPAYILTAARLDHFADDDSAELKQPVFEFRGDKDHWRISAQRASIRDNRDVIHFYDNVQLTRVGNEQQGPMRIDTEYLKIDTQRKTAETDQPALLKTRDLELNTVGMVLDNNEGILKLNAQVRGQYAPLN